MTRKVRAVERIIIYTVWTGPGTQDKLRAIVSAYRMPIAPRKNRWMVRSGIDVLIVSLSLAEMSGIC